MLWLCMLGVIYLLYRFGTFWLWRARLTGSQMADRLSYGFFLCIGSIICISADFQVFHSHIQFSSIWLEALIDTLPSIFIGEFLYLRKVTSIVHTLALLKSRNARIQKQ